MQIYRTYFEDVYLYIRRLSGNEAIAEEITSEAFFKAMRSIGGFRGDCDIRVWLCQIAKNCYYTYLKKSRHTENIDDVELPESPPGESATEEQCIRREAAKHAAGNMNRPKSPGGRKRRRMPLRC